MNYSGRLEDRDVLVTGANGFVGSHLIEKLLEHGADVTAFVRATPGMKNLEHLRDELDIVRGDLQDPVSVRDAVKKVSKGEDVLVFHLGAQAHVGESWKRPHETIKTNVIGTLNLLEAIRSEDVSISKFNTAGTSEEYGNFDPDKSESYHFGEKDNSVRLDESSPLNPESVYGTSKVAADFLTQNYHEAYGIPAITTRMFNNYGPRQSPRFITGTVISQALKREKVEVGNLSPRRVMCFVEDGVRGHLDATLEGEPGEVYAFGHRKNISMKEWVKRILEVGEKNGYWKDVSVVQTEERFRPGDSDVEHLHADYKKLHDLTGWEPEVGWKKGLRKTIEWYSGNEDKWLGDCDWR